MCHLHSSLMCAHRRAHTHTHARTHAHTYTQTESHTRSHTHIHNQTRARIHTRTHSKTHAHFGDQVPSHVKLCHLSLDSIYYNPSLYNYLLTLRVSPQRRRIFLSTKLSAVALLSIRMAGRDILGQVLVVVDGSDITRARRHLPPRFRTF